MRKKIGLLLRSYAKKAEDVDGVVDRAVKSVTYAYGLRNIVSEPIFGAIVVLVPCDYDCGTTANAILRALPHSYINENVYVIEVSGYHSCGALNDGMGILSNLGMDYAVVISNKAIAALKAPITDSMLEAFDVGAKVVGVAIDELQDIVIGGRIQNTFAGWDIKALCGVGGFDSEKGVEEISPTVRLIREYGSCIAVLDPKDKPALDIRKTVDGDARHNEVMTTKIARQQEEVDRMEADFDFIKTAIMPGYPRSV